MDRKERCLKSLIANGDGIGLYTVSHLVLIRDLFSSGGTCSGSTQKYEEWIAALKRNHMV